MNTTTTTIELTRANRIALTLALQIARTQLADVAEGMADDVKLALFLDLPSKVGMSVLTGSLPEELFEDLNSMTDADDIQKACDDHAAAIDTDPIEYDGSDDAG